MFVNPLAGQNFDGLQGGARSGLGVGAAEKAADVGLGRLYQHDNIVAQGHCFSVGGLSYGDEDVPEKGAA
jgi:hypothetical protein